MGYVLVAEQPLARVSARWSAPDARERNEWQEASLYQRDGGGVVAKVALLSTHRRDRAIELVAECADLAAALSWLRQIDAAQGLAHDLPDSPAIEAMRAAARLSYSALVEQLERDATPVT